MEFGKEKLVEMLTDGSYLREELLPGQKKMFEDAFTFVDGVRYPLSLVHPDIEQEGNQNRLIGSRIVKGDDFSADCSVDDWCKKSVSGNIGAIYMARRRLFVPDIHGRSYSSGLGVNDKLLKGLISSLSADFGHRTLNVLDAGCGIGAAFKDLLELDEVDKYNSVGLTIPLSTDLSILDQRLLYANIMHAGAKRRFDMLFSVRGAFYYHPTNMYSQKHSALFGVLHSVNLTAEGGLLCNDFVSIGGGKLVEKGIIKAVNGAVFRVLRHPTVDEVMELMVR